MRCEGCGNELERPGDFCLRCHESNTDAIVLTLEEERAELTMFAGQTELGTTAITTLAETEERKRERQERDFIERVAGEIRRKRPDQIYVAGDRPLIARLRREVSTTLYRIEGPDPVARYRETVGEAPVPVVDVDPRDKLGGRHTSVIGDRRGGRAIELIADNPHVKKVVPGPIDASGPGSQHGFLASATRATPDGNLRVLLRDGASVQTLRVVTTAGDLATGERIGTQLNEAFEAEGIGR